MLAIKVLRAVALTTGLLFSDPAISQPIYQKVDTFSGVTHYFTKRRDANLEGGSFFSSRYVSFDLNGFSGPDCAKLRLSDSHVLIFRRPSKISSVPNP
jgi:hypothetical protein